MREFSTKWPISYSSFKKSYSSSLGFDSSSFYGSTIGSYKDYSKFKWSYDTRLNKEEQNKIKKLKAAYKPVRDLVVILDYPFKVDICFTQENFSYNQSKRLRYVFVPTECLDEKLSEEDAIGLLSGEGIHEAAHLKYTALRVLTKFLSGSTVRHDFDTINSSSVNDYSSGLNFLVNILEDERVEDKLLKERPGYSLFIEKKKTT